MAVKARKGWALFRRKKPSDEWERAFPDLPLYKDVDAASEAFQDFLLVGTVYGDRNGWKEYRLMYVHGGSIDTSKSPPSKKQLEEAEKLFSPKKTFIREGKL